jgi:hypothetical protein
MIKDIEHQLFQKVYNRFGMKVLSSLTTRLLSKLSSLSMIASHLEEILSLVILLFSLSLILS